MTEKTALVLYHASCPDGLCSAWAAWKKLGDSADYKAVNYHHSVFNDQWFEGRDVYLVDFSYPLATLERLSKLTKSITVLDHHQSAVEALAGSPFAKHLRQDWSGAHITWDFFHPNQNLEGPLPPFNAYLDGPEGSRLPAIVRYVEDNDLWHHKLPKWEAVKVVVEMMDINAKDAIQQWDTFAQRMESSFWEITEQGNAIIEYRNALLKRVVYDPAFTILDGHKVPCVNAALWQSEIGDLLDKKHPFAVVWRMTKEGTFAYSLRSDRETGIDVAAIAQKFGGGGHTHSAGFSSNSPPMIVPK
jgi:oligoribonuclease NrnB/cAMP/cGMP phosphodiesterase (DHH superfamily)